MTCYLYNYYTFGPRTVPVSYYMRSIKLNKLPCSNVFSLHYTYMVFIAENVCNYLPNTAAFSQQ